MQRSGISPGALESESPTEYYSSLAHPSKFNYTVSQQGALKICADTQQKKDDTL